MVLDLQRQYNLIYSYFKTTTEPYDELIWDGVMLMVFLNDIKIEEYSYLDLKIMIDNF